MKTTESEFNDYIKQINIVIKPADYYNMFLSKTLIMDFFNFSSKIRDPNENFITDLYGREMKTYFCDSVGYLNCLHKQVIRINNKDILYLNEDIQKLYKIRDKNHNHNLHLSNVKIILIPTIRYIDSRKL